MALTPKQKRFVEEYLIDLNATQAAIRAGYSERNADKIGPELLGKTRVKEAINKRMAKRSQRTEITADRVLQELAKIAFANTTDFARVTTKTTYVMDWNKETEQFEPKEVEQRLVEVFDTDKLPEDKKAAIAAIKHTKHGIVVEPHDKVRALELLGKHLVLFTDKQEITGEAGGPIEINFTGELDKWSR